MKVFTTLDLAESLRQRLSASGWRYCAVGERAEMLGIPIPGDGLGGPGPEYLKKMLTVTKKLSPEQADSLIRLGLSASKQARKLVDTIRTIYRIGE